MPLLRARVLLAAGMYSSLLAGYELAETTTAAATDTTEPTDTASTGTESFGTAPATTEVDGTSAHESPPLTVTGPTTGGTGQDLAATQDLSSGGYIEEEFFISGEAPSYRMTSGATSEDIGSVAPDDFAAFTTRMIVRRPSDPTEFSGTVLVEWLNVSTGRDFDGHWNYVVDEVIREGHAYVGVSAQMIGVRYLIDSDAERYGELRHPGDRYSWDIFTQAAAALSNPEGPAPLGALAPELMIAAGFSQSADLLVTYLAAVQPMVDAYDGYFVHDSAGTMDATRRDLRSPVLIFRTETELGAGSPDGQDDSDTVRTWEVAGTSHVDQHLVDESEFADNPQRSGLVDCGGAVINDGPHHQIAQAALHHLVTWAAGGPLPPSAPRIAVTDGVPPVIERDEHGIAVGGVRSPLVDVPIATLTAEPASNGPGPTCVLSGATIPFDAATLAELYPTHADYVTAFTESANAAVEAGFLLRPDADEMIAEAEQVTFE